MITTVNPRPANEREQAYADFNDDKRTTQMELHNTETRYSILTKSLKSLEQASKNLTDASLERHNDMLDEKRTELRTMTFKLDELNGKLKTMSVDQYMPNPNGEDAQAMKALRQQPRRYMDDKTRIDLMAEMGIDEFLKLPY